MTLRSSFVLLSACLALALAACDSGSDDTTGAGSTSGGDESSTSGTNPTGVSITVTATTPTTDPSTTVDPSDTDGTSSSTDPSGDSSSSGEFGSSSGEAGSSSGSSGTGGEAVTIYDVQDGTVAEGETVSLEGVVITALRLGVGVVVQEAAGGEYSGVYVDTAEIDLSTFAVGDIVDLTGDTAESNPVTNGLEGLTQILVGESGSMTATGETMKLAAQEVDFGVLADPDTAEPWESVLITTTGTFTATTFGDFFGQFGEFAAVEGENLLLIDNFLYAIFDEDNAGDFPGFAEGATFTGLSGTLNYSFGNFKLAPRSSAELEGYVAPG